jgi:hypothetical protein
MAEDPTRLLLPSLRLLPTTLEFQPERMKIVIPRVMSRASRPVEMVVAVEEVMAVMAAEEDPTRLPPPLLRLLPQSAMDFPLRRSILLLTIRVILQVMFRASLPVVMVVEEAMAVMVEEEDPTRLLLPSPRLLPQPATGFPLRRSILLLTIIVILQVMFRASLPVVMVVVEEVMVEEEEDPTRLLLPSPRLLLTRLEFQPELMMIVMHRVMSRASLPVIIVVEETIPPLLLPLPRLRSPDLAFPLSRSILLLTIRVILQVMSRASLPVVTLVEVVEEPLLPPRATRLFPLYRPISQVLLPLTGLLCLPVLLQVLVRLLARPCLPVPRLVLVRLLAPPYLPVPRLVLARLLARLLARPCLPVPRLVLVRLLALPYLRVPHQVLVLLRPHQLFHCYQVMFALTLC